MEDEVDHKIYVKIMCTACLGGKRSGVFGNCPYCNSHRTTYVEASIKTIKDNLKHILSKEQKREIIEALQEGDDEE